MADIKIENLKYHYPDKQKPSLDLINLEIPEGQFVLIVGGSGSGKSSLVRAMAGLIPDFYGGIYDGKVCFDSEELRQIDRRRLVQQVGMVFQNPENQLVMTNVEQEIAFGMENVGMPNSLMKRRLMEVSSALGLSSYLNSFIPELSGGLKQKTALASVLAMHPDILLLDEPTSQLDPVAGEEILTIIRRLNEENGITVILIEQRLERCFHLADRILVMNEGKIVYDHHDPEAIADWALKNNTPFLPPLAKLFAETGYPQIPVTVKQGRKILKSCCPFESSIKGKQITLNSPQKILKEKKEKSLVDIQNLWFTYANGQEALKNINLDIVSGEFVAIMGENGAGKSTLIKNINRLLKPGRGHVIIEKRDTGKYSIEELASVAGYLSQDPNDYLFLPSVREEIVYTMNNLGLKDDGIIQEILERLYLMPYAEKNPKELSTGERQRVALASVLAAKPKLLLLDEPTRGLDYLLKKELGDILIQFQKEGTAVIIVTHDVEFAAEYADRIILMAEGTIVADGSKYDILTNSTFYSPQVSKLFNNIIDNVVTIEQGKDILNRIIKKNDDRVISV